MDTTASNSKVDSNSEFEKKFWASDFSKAVKLCYQCGICTGGCLSAPYTNLRPHELIYRASLGMENVVDSDMLWFCLRCNRCANNCREKIEVCNVIGVLRSIAADRKLAPAAFIKTAKLFSETSFSFPITKYTEKLRTDCNLNKIEPNRNTINEITKILEITGLTKVLKKYETL